MVIPTQVGFCEISLMARRFSEDMIQPRTAAKGVFNAVVRDSLWRPSCMEPFLFVQSFLGRKTESSLVWAWSEAGGILEALGFFLTFVNKYLDPVSGSLHVFPDIQDVDVPICWYQDVKIQHATLVVVGVYIVIFLVIFFSSMQGLPETCTKKRFNLCWNSGSCCYWQDMSTVYSLWVNGLGASQRFFRISSFRLSGLGLRRFPRLPKPVGPPKVVRIRGGRRVRWWGFLDASLLGSEWEEQQVNNRSTVQRVVL